MRPRAWWSDHPHFIPLLRVNHRMVSLTHPRHLHFHWTHYGPDASHTYSDDPTPTAPYNLRAIHWDDLWCWHCGTLWQPFCLLTPCLQDTDNYFCCRTKWLSSNCLCLTQAQSLRHTDDTSVSPPPLFFSLDDKNHETPLYAPASSHSPISVLCFDEDMMEDDDQPTPGANTHSSPLHRYPTATPDNGDPLPHLLMLYLGTSYNKILETYLWRTHYCMRTTWWWLMSNTMMMMNPSSWLNLVLKEIC